MTTQEKQHLHGEIDLRFPDNTTGDITPSDVRDFLHGFVDAASTSLLRTGSELHFDRAGLYAPIATGCFTVSLTDLQPGAVVRVVLEPAATLPTTTASVSAPAVLDPAVFHTTSPAPAVGRTLEFLFLVGYDGAHIEYLVTQLD